MFTKTPHGYHRTFRIKEEDFPDGVKTYKPLVLKDHNEITIIGKKHILRERGPDIEIINDVEYIQTLDAFEVNELFNTLNKVGNETNAITKVADLLLPYYYQPHRDNIVFTFSGYLHKNRTPEYITKKIARCLISLTNYYDEQPEKTMKVIEDTYAKDSDSDQVSGYKAFLDALEDAYPDENKVSNGNGNGPSSVINKIQEILGKAGLFTINSRRSQQQGEHDNSDNIPSEIFDQLANNIYLKINDEPIVLIVSHKESGRILRMKVNSHNEGQQGNQHIVHDLSPKNTIIDAIPIKVVINESPIDGTKTYQITFLHYGSKRKNPFTVGPNPIKTIIADLQDRGRYVDKDADKFLTGILTKYEDNELAELNNRVLESGYYYIDKKIVGYDITQKLDQEISKDEVLNCINVIEELRHKYKKQELIPTVVKWGIVAPFSYVKKCHSISGSNWLPALAPYGRKRTGKNTAGVIALAICRKHTVKDKPIHQIGVGSIDSPARFGRAVSQTTYPVMSSEVDLNNEKLKWLVEMIKYEIESTTVRGRYIDRHRFEDIRALSDIILTSNHRPPRDDAFLTRIIPIPFGRKDDTTTEQKKEFEKWLYDEGRIDKLGVLGDFATKQIITAEEYTRKKSESSKI